MRLSRQQVRELDRRAIEEYGLPGIVLMENAGRGAADVLVSLGAAGPVVFCCGKGNNGGDGFVIARHLDSRSVPVRILLFASGSDLHGDAAVNYRVTATAGIPIIEGADRLPSTRLQAELAGADWIVDALFGTGLGGPVRSPFAEIIETINAVGRKVLAVDIPSGLDCDTGQALGVAVRAQHTVTFVASKKGFSEPAARGWLGEVHVIPIGVPRRLLESYETR